MPTQWKPVNSPATNFGWCVLGEEAVADTVKRFDTREVTRGFAVHGGLRRVSHGRGAFSRLVARWHQWLARAAARRTPPFRREDPPASS